MNKSLEAFKLNEIPAKKSHIRDPFLAVHNNITGKTRKLVDKQIPFMKVAYNRFKDIKKESSKVINIDSRKNLFEEVPDNEHTSEKDFNIGVVDFKSYNSEKADSPLKIVYNKGKEKSTQVAENIANFGKDNFINPYPNAQLNTIDLFLGKWIDNTKPSVFPKLVKSTMIGSYIGTWLDTVLMPTKIPHLASKTRDTLNGILIPPFKWSFNKINNGYKRIKKFVLPKKIYERNIKNKKIRREKFREKIIKPLGRLRSWVNKKISFKKKNVFKLQPKNEEFYEKLEDAA